MLLWHDDFWAIFLIAVIPGVLAIALLFFVLQEPTPPIEHKRSNPFQRENLARLGRTYWWVVGLGAVFTLARFSEAFLVLRALQMDIPQTLIPLVMVAMNLLYAVSAYPFGKLSDRMSHSMMLQTGLLVLIRAGCQYALDRAPVWCGALGDPYGDDPRVAGSDDTNTAPADLRGTAFGMFNLMSGVALLLVSLGAGILWETWGAASTSAR